MPVCYVDVVTSAYPAQSMIFRVLPWSSFRHTHTGLVLPLWIIGLPVAFGTTTLACPETRTLHCTGYAVPISWGLESALCDDLQVPDVHLVHRVGFVLLRDQWDCCSIGR